MGEIIRQFEEERDLEIMAAIDTGEAFTDIAERFSVSEDHVQSIWEAMCVIDDPEGIMPNGFAAPLLIIPLALLAWAPIVALVVWGG